MNRRINLIALSAMLIAASCSNDFTEQVNQGTEIGFNASVGGPTRATEVVLSTSRCMRILYRTTAISTRPR